jgi:hypothetical protein
MAAAESQMLPLGTGAPEFSLPDPQGRMHALQDGAAATVVMFICNHCPFVKHIREELARIGRDYSERNVAVYAINSNDADRYPGDTDIYVFDADRLLVYRGQLDDSRPSNNAPIDGKDLRAALHAVLAGEAVSEVQTPSIGCSIKWKPGNEPDYS